MNYDYSKRDYLLPQGCKDLIDVLKLEAQKKALQQHHQPAPLPPIGGEIVVPEHTTVLQLAAMLSQKPFQMITALMEVGVFANVNQEVEFDAVAKVIQKHG